MDRAAGAGGCLGPYRTISIPRSRYLCTVLRSRPVPRAMAEMPIPCRFKSLIMTISPKVTMPMLPGAPGKSNADPGATRSGIFQSALQGSIGPVLTPPRQSCSAAERVSSRRRRRGLITHRQIRRHHNETSLESFATRLSPGTVSDLIQPSLSSDTGRWHRVCCRGSCNSQPLSPSRCPCRSTHCCRCEPARRRSDRQRRNGS